jgi:hypothetical protein
MTITGQDLPTSTTGAPAGAAADADRQHGTESLGNTSKGEFLTGKQEHCEYFHFYTLYPFSRCLSLHGYSGLTDAEILFENADLKRELIGLQVRSEIAELNSPTALKRFGAPFKSEFGEVAPVDSDLPILRYIFVHHVRNFPFLDQAREKEFWQDKLQVVRLTRG